MTRNQFLDQEQSHDPAQIMCGSIMLEKSPKMLTEQFQGKAPLIAVRDAQGKVIGAVPDDNRWKQVE